MEVKNFFALLLALTMLFSPAMAAVTVTVNTGLGTINNLPANIRNYDINFTVADNNAAVRDLNVNIKYYSVLDGISISTWIVTDGNLWDWNANPTPSRRCSASSAWTSATCAIIWTVPSSVVLGNGTYMMDFNVVDWTAFGEQEMEANADDNGEVAFTIQNKLGSGAAIRALIQTMGLVLVGVILVSGLVGITVLNLDATKTTIFMVITAIAVGIVSWVAGIVLATL